MNLNLDELKNEVLAYMEAKHSWCSTDTPGWPTPIPLWHGTRTACRSTAHS